MVLGVYREPNEKQPEAIKIPDDKLAAVDNLLCKRKGITIGGKHYPDEQVIGLFDDKEWINLRENLLKPPVEIKTWDDMREAEWYKKAKAMKANRK